MESSCNTSSQRVRESVWTIVPVYVWTDRDSEEEAEPASTSFYTLGPFVMSSARASGVGLASAY